MNSIGTPDTFIYPRVHNLLFNILKNSLNVRPKNKIFLLTPNVTDRLLLDPMNKIIYEKHMAT